MVQLLAPVSFHVTAYMSDGSSCGAALSQTDLTPLESEDWLGLDWSFANNDVR